VLLQSHGTEVGGQHGEALAGEMERVATVSGAQFEHVMGAAAAEDLCGVHGRVGRLPSVHPGVLVVRLVPVLTLTLGQLAPGLRPAAPFPPSDPHRPLDQPA
jgi:hypothetical protein